MVRGFIYFYAEGYVGQTVNLRLRRVRHLRKGRKWKEPIILETVVGANRNDLLFNMSFQETIWIFKMHTYRRLWPGGLTVNLPDSNDHKLPGILNRGLVRSEETRAKIRAARKFQKNTRKGIPHSPEVRAKLSKIQKVIMSKPEERKRVSEQTKAAMRRPEVVQKLKLGYARRKASMGNGRQEKFLW